jgi:hypothetical protein
MEEPALESLAGTLELGEDDSRTITDPGRIALFGSIAVVPIIRNPERYGLARTLFEILSFQPTRMKTQRFRMAHCFQDGHTEVGQQFGQGVSGLWYRSCGVPLMEMPSMINPKILVTGKHHDERFA